jgi:hypothetical protein
VIGEYGGVSGEADRGASCTRSAAPRSSRADSFVALLRIGVEDMMVHQQEWQTPKLDYKKRTFFSRLPLLLSEPTIRYTSSTVKSRVVLHGTAEGESSST